MTTCCVLQVAGPSEVRSVPGQPRSRSARAQEIDEIGRRQRDGKREDPGMLYCIILVLVPDFRLFAEDSESESVCQSSVPAPAGCSTDGSEPTHSRVHHPNLLTGNIGWLVGWRTNDSDMTCRHAN